MQYIITEQQSNQLTRYDETACPQWEKEKKILKIKCENSLSFPEACKPYKQLYTGQTYASAVKPGTCNKSTHTDDRFTEYLKQ